MGIYVNLGNGNLRMAVNSKIYVDKTGLIECHWNRTEMNLYEQTKKIREINSGGDVGGILWQRL